ncbi:MAG: DNA/RNA nuclease SfsA [Promethearchaeota archaeon]
MGLPSPLYGGEFVERENRFVAVVRAKEDPGNQSSRRVHVPNPGRMVHLLVSGARVLYSTTYDPRRKVPATLVLVESGGHLVSVNSTLPNKLVGLALARGAFPEIGGVTAVRPEYGVGGSRIDFMVERGGRGRPRRALVEVKSCTHVGVDGTARFPDAPTKRGRRHVSELAELHASGEWESFVVFVVQHPAGFKFRPFDEVDPEFGKILREAARAGVRVLAYSTTVTRQRVCLAAPVPVLLD